MLSIHQGTDPPRLLGKAIEPLLEWLSGKAWSARRSSFNRRSAADMDAGNQRTQ